MPSPVLEEIKTLLVTVYPDRFKDPIEKCLGTNAGDGQSCNKWPMQRDIATQRMRSLALLGEVPHDESFFREIEEFLCYSHCSWHRPVVLDKFETWRQKKEQPVVDPVAPVPTSPILGGSHDADQSEAHPHLPNASMQTPKNSGGDSTNRDKYDILSDALGSTTPSPSPESEIGSVASPATTAITTPGSTPPDENVSVGPFDALGDSNPPATPTPAPRKSSRPVADREATDEVLTDDDIAHNTNPADILGVTKRMRTVNTKKWPLLRVIEKPFGKRDYEDGRVYVWRHEKEERLIKIGFTATGSKDRHQQSNNCYAKNTKEQWKSPVPFVGAYRVEQLMRKSLGTRNIELEWCQACGAQHREWYELPWDEAVKEIELWTQFVIKAYVDGRLSKEGNQMLDVICDPKVEKLVDMLSADNGSLLAEGLTAMSEERNEAGQHTIILDEQVSAPAGNEELSVVADLAPGPYSTNQNTASSSPGQARFQGSPKSGTKAAIRDFLSDLKKRGLIKIRGSYSGRDEFSEQAKEKRDNGKEFVSKLFQKFWSPELKEVEDKLAQNQSNPPGTRGDSPSKKRGWVWKLKFKLHIRSRDTAQF